jgi:hypothetical protein
VRRAPLFIVPLLLLALTAPAAADPARRLLGGHRLIHPGMAGFPAPGITSHLGFVQGLAFIGAPDVAISDAVDDLVDFDLRVLGVQESLSVGVVFLDWLAAEAAVSGHVLAGLNGDSALIMGGLAAYGLNLGPAFQVLDASTTRLVLRARFHNGYDLHVSPLDYVNASLARETLAPSGRLVTSTRTFAGSASASLAQVVDPHFSVQLGMVGRVNSLEGGEEALYGQLQAFLAATIDLAPSVPQVPLAILIEYQFEKSFGDPDRGQDVLAHHVGGGLFYTGRPDLQLGAHVSTAFLPDTELFPQGRTFLHTQLILVYFF